MELGVYMDIILINKVKIKSKVPELYEDALKETAYKKGINDANRKMFVWRLG